MLFSLGAATPLLADAMAIVAFTSTGEKERVLYLSLVTLERCDVGVRGWAAGEVEGGYGCGMGAFERTSGRHRVQQGVWSM